MNKSMMRQAGLTLIELMVVLVVMGSLLAVAVPYATGWLDNSAVIESSALIQQATTRTKARAIENPQAIVNGAAAAYMCGKAGSIYVQPVNAENCGSGFVWQAVLNSNVQVEVGSASWICTGFNSRGLPVPLALGGSNCATTTAMTISRGRSSDARSFY